MLFEKRGDRFAIRMLATMFAASALATLAACGGGTYQQESFAPARVLSFGDESSRLEGPQGLKYSINGISNAARAGRLHGEPDLDAGGGQLVRPGLSRTATSNASFETNAIDLTTVDAHGGRRGEFGGRVPGRRHVQRQRPGD